MDIIDKIVITLALLYVAALVVGLGQKCAQSVWDRTKEKLDDTALSEAAHVPFTTTGEAMLIMVAATMLNVFLLPLRMFEYYYLSAQERQEELQKVYSSLHLGRGVLWCVSAMMSGYPERAERLFIEERVNRTRQRCQAEAQDYHTLHGTNQLS